MNNYSVEKLQNAIILARSTDLMDISIPFGIYLSLTAKAVKLVAAVIIIFVWIIEPTPYRTGPCLYR